MRTVTDVNKQAVKDSDGGESSLGVNRGAIREWVAALRSGQFDQGKGKLHVKGEMGNPDEFCCLGVACALFKDRVGLPVGESELLEVVTYSGEENYPPLVLVEYLGLESEGHDTGNVTVKVDDPLIGRPEVFVDELNDTHNYDFHQIADAIERTYLSEGERA